MKTKLLVEIGRALLLARWRQTLVAAIGVTFSISMFIALLGFMEGLNDLLDGLMLNRTAHVRLYNEIKPSDTQPIQRAVGYRTRYNFIHSIKPANARQQIHNSEAILNTLRHDKRVLGVAPRLVTPVFFNAVAVELAGVVNGIEVANETALFNFDDYIIEGKSLDIEQVPNSIVLGKGLADNLCVSLGDRVQVSTLAGGQFYLKVVGLFKTGIQDIDKSQSYASVAIVQKLMGKPASYISELQVKLQNVEEAPVAAKEFANLFDIDAIDIQTANAQFETGSFVRSLISYAVGIVLLIVAGFGIYNILNMMIYEKMDTIAILKATGFAGTDVRNIFLFIAVSIGISGGLVGLVVGFGLSGLIDQIPFTAESLPKVKTYPVNYSPIFYLIGLLFSLITTFFAGWLPARKASKIDPVIIIRGN